MFNINKEVSDLVLRVVEEFKLVKGFLSAFSTKLEEIQNNIVKTINSTMINSTSNLWSVSVEDCYINRDAHVDCVSVDKTTDHIKFLFQGGVWRGYFEIVLDNLFPYPNYPLKTNTDYIVSFELNMSERDNSRIQIQEVFTKLYGNTKTTGTVNTTQTNDGWTRFEMAIRTTDQVVDRGSFGFYITKADFSGIPEGGELHLRKLQIQEGSISTFFNKNFNRDVSPTQIQIHEQSAATFLRGTNLFIKKNATPHYLINNGTLANADYFNLTSEYIPVEPGTYIYQVWTEHIAGTIGKDQWHAYCFYDSNKAPIGVRQVRSATVNTVPSMQYYRWDITVPDGVAYIRIGSRHLQSINSKVMFERVNLYGGFIPAYEDTEAASKRLYTYTKSLSYTADTVVLYFGTSVINDPNTNTWTVSKSEWDLSTGLQVGNTVRSVNTNLNMKTLDESKVAVQWQ